MQATTTTGSMTINEGGNTEIAKSLIKILNAFYTSGVDRIKTYGKTPGGNIVGEFIADGTSFQYILNLNTNTVSYEVVGSKSASKIDSLLAEQENADRLKIIYSVREAFEISDASEIEQKLDSWFFRADAPTKAKVGVKTAANKSGKTLTCTPGKTFPCGAVCRAMGKPCKQPMSPEVQEIAKQVAAKIKTPTATTIPTAKPATITAPPASTTTEKITAQKMAEQIVAAKALEQNPEKEQVNQRKLRSTYVAVKRITPPTQEFDPDDLKVAAESILKLGGFIEPPVLRRTAMGFDIVSGEFQVAAAIVAKAMKPLSGENLGAIIIDEENDNEEAVMTQVNLMKRQRANKELSPKKETTKTQSIESYDDFKKTANNTYEKLNKSYNYGGLVPIWHLRSELGQKVKREEFNDWIMKMQADRSFYLQSGEARGATDEQKRNSISDDVRGLLFFASRPSS